MSNVYKANGINQWFINALRNDNNIVNMADFTHIWTNWNDKLSYQFDSVIANGASKFDNNKFYINDTDYDIHLKKSPAAKDMWLHSIAVSLYNKGMFRVNNGAYAPSNNGDDWTFRLSTLIPFEGTLNYYDIRRYKITDIDVSGENNYLLFDKAIPWNFDNKLTVNLESTRFSAKYEYRIIDKGINAYKEHMYGLSKYNIDKQEYEEVPLYDTIRSYTANPYAIKDQDIVFDGVQGIINRFTQTSFIWPTFNNINYINVPDIGSNVAILNDGALLASNLYTIDGNNITIDSSITVKNLEVFNLTALPFRDYDILYDTNTNTVKQYRRTTGTWATYSTTSNVIWVPDLVGSNVVIINEGMVMSSLDYSIDGNKITLHSNVNVNKIEVRTHIPLNTTIDEIQEKFTVSNKYCPYEWKRVVADRNVIKTFNGMPSTITGVQNLIDFIYGYAEYQKDQGFIFNDIDRPFINKYISGTFSWQNEIENLINKIWNGFITAFDSGNDVQDYYTLNPFKYELWINTPEGIISDIINGPYRDVILYPLVYDKHGNAIKNTDNLKIFRTDTESHITYPYTSDGNHIGGMRLFLDFYENVVSFNDYTINDNLIYDSFTGLNTEDIQVEFNKNAISTKRPNIGGGVIVDNQLIDNLESNAEIFQQFYNTYTSNEHHKHIKDARHTVGYYDLPYMKQFNEQSKFVFWRGMIHQKGTLNCLEAFRKESLYRDISVDELWMYKVAEFGDPGIKKDQYVNILNSDVSNNNILYQFADTNVDSNFTRISSVDASRWSGLDNNLFINSPSVSNIMRIVKNHYANVSVVEKNTTEYSYLKNTIILDNECDHLEVYAEYQYNKFYQVQFNNDVTLSVEYYIPGTGMISCFVDGVKINVVEKDNYTIVVPKYNQTTTIDIRYNRALLTENIHYSVLRNNVIKLLGFDFDIIDIKMYNYINDLTVGLMDTTDRSIIDNLHYYNPRMGAHNPLIKDHVDYMVNYDPANYTDAIWATKEVGSKWLCTKDLGFHHYNDKRIYPDTLDRISLWGAFADWSKVTCYEWIESDVPPDQWVTSTNITLTNDQKQTGTPYKILQKCIRADVSDNFVDWVNESNRYQIVYLCMSNIVNGSTTINIDININEGDNYNVYLNEVKYTNYSTSIIDGSIFSITVNNIEAKDIIRIVRFADTPAASNFEDNGTSLVLYRYVYNYNTVSSFDSRGLSRANKYYFWATNQINRNDLSTNDIEQIFVYNNNPYFGLQMSGGQYDQWIIRNMRPIGKNNALHVVKDETLTRTSDVSKNNQYSEWALIKPHSDTKIDINLWNKLIETMIGSTIDGISAVPSANHIIFDDINKKTTKYGIGKYQCLGDKDLVIKSVSDMLYYQVNIDGDRDKTLAVIDFSSSAAIIKTMLYMYTNLSADNVNEIFFNILKDLYTYTNEVDNIIKTSYISIHCTQVIKTNV